MASSVSASNDGQLGGRGRRQFVQDSARLARRDVDRPDQLAAGGLAPAANLVARSHSAARTLESLARRRARRAGPPSAHRDRRRPLSRTRRSPRRARAATRSATRRSTRRRRRRRRRTPGRSRPSTFHRRPTPSPRSRRAGRRPQTSFLAEKREQLELRVQPAFEAPVDLEQDPLADHRRRCSTGPLRAAARQASRRHRSLPARPRAVARGPPRVGTRGRRRRVRTAGHRASPGRRARA